MYEIQSNNKTKTIKAPRRAPSDILKIVSEKRYMVSVANILQGKLNTIKLWDLQGILNKDDLQPFCELYENTESKDITSIEQLNDGSLASSRLNENEIHIWSIEKCQSIKTITINFENNAQESILSLKKIGKNLLAVGLESKVLIINTETREQINSLSIEGRLSDLEATSFYLYCSNQSGQTKVWDINNEFQSLKNLEENPNQSSIKNNLEIIDEKKILAWDNFSGEICIWNELALIKCYTNSKSYNHLEILNNENDRIEVITSSANGFIRIYNLNDKLEEKITKRPVTSIKTMVGNLDSKILINGKNFLNILNKVVQKY